LCGFRIAPCASWSFYLINDAQWSLDLTVLYEICSEWGDFGRVQTADVRVLDFAPGAHVLLWRDDGELRSELALLIQARGRVVRANFEFPRLYRQHNLPVVRGLGKPGWETALAAVRPYSSDARQLRGVTSGGD
jgi:hypothetical protein